MNYLYGDSTPSQLTSNFLEFLRDALDFAVFVLQADARIKDGKARIVELESAATAELERLDRFVGVVADAILGGEKGAEGSPTAECATRLAELCASEQRQTSDRIRSRLAAEIAQIEAAEGETRDACAAALGALLWPHLPPDSASTQHHVLGQDRLYQVSVTGRAAFGLSWAVELAIPETSAWSSPIRLERVSTHIEIRVPQVTGWITKEVKVKPLRIEKYVVTELETAGLATRLVLRLEPTLDSGFDLDVDAATGSVRMARVGPDDGAGGPFDVHPEDAATLIEIAEKLRLDAATLDHGRLTEAALDGASVRELPRFAPLVERLVAMLAPIVREISARSLMPSELVLRRALADDRREEFFMAKSTLREKYGVLPPETQTLFAPLALDDGPRPASDSPAASGNTPVSRAEIAISKPQPPPVPPRPPPAAKPPPPPPPPPPPAAQPPPPPPPPPTVVSPKPSTPPPPAVNAKPSTPPPAPPPAAPVSVKPSTPPPPNAVPRPSTAPASASPPSEGRDERFVEAVKKIVLVLKSGRTDDGYQQYADLLRAGSFTQYRPDDQRQAIKMLLLAKPPAVRTEPVSAAFHAAVDRIQALIDAHADPADYEMLGVARLHLEEKQAAHTAFEVALKLERARNPSSDLVSNLERRLSQVGAS